MFFLNCGILFCAGVVIINLLRHLFQQKVRFKYQTENYLNQFLPAAIHELSDLFEAEGYKLYLVGGCIRDTFLRKVPKDYDLCTDLMPNKVEELLKSKGYACKLQGEHFGVVAVQIEDATYEIATFREDLNNTTDRNTDVRFGVTIFDDVLRRDFTINALFFDIQQGTVLDLVGGIKDLRAGLIRAVGNASTRFDEDNLRKLRAIRFASRLGFEIESATKDAIIANPQLNVTLERIYAELLTSYTTSKDLPYLTKLLYETGLMKVIFKNVNCNMVIDFTKISSFSTWIAEICRHLPTLIKEILSQLKFPTVIGNNVEFLLKYSSTDINHVRLFSPLQFYKQIQSCDLTSMEILRFGQNTVHLKFLVNFKPDSAVTKKYQSEGCLGKDLGNKLNQHYKLKYISAISQHSHHKHI